jgi:hypothetical protein
LFKGILALHFVAILRYLFIFKLKNPAGFKDEFWDRFYKTQFWAKNFSDKISP